MSEAKYHSMLNPFRWRISKDNYGYQLVFHRLTSPNGVRTFTVKRGLSGNKVRTQKAQEMIRVIKHAPKELGKSNADQ